MCEMLGNRMKNQHLGFVQYSYGRSRILLAFGIIASCTTKGYQSCPL